MNRARQRPVAGWTAVLAAMGVIACVAILTYDYVGARRRAPRDDATIAALQEQVRENASLAPKLEAEHKRITQARDIRKARINVLSILLIGAGAAFLGGANWWLAMQAKTGLKQDSSVRQSVTTAGRAGRAPQPDRPPQPPGIDLTLVDQIVAREGRSREAAIPILQAIQAHYRYLPDEALQRVCALTDITPAQIAGTSSFYARFRRSPVGKHIVRVCHGTACHVSGARLITEELRRTLNIPEGADTDSSRRFTVDEVACLGCCSLAPVMMVDEHTVGNLSPATARYTIESFEQQERS